MNQQMLDKGVKKLKLQNLKMKRENDVFFKNGNKHKFKQSK